jgi:hypothetical protein
MDAGHGGRQNREAGASGHAYGGREPNDGSVRKSPNKVFPDEDDAAANEPDSRNDLGSDARRVHDDAAVLKDVGKAVFGSRAFARRLWRASAYPKASSASLSAAKHIASPAKPTAKVPKKTLDQ